MPICRLVPGILDQCENVDTYFSEIDQASWDRCIQQYPDCGPIKEEYMPIPQPQGHGGKHKTRYRRKKTRRNRRSIVRKRRN